MSPSSKGEITTFKWNKPYVHATFMIWPSSSFAPRSHLMFVCVWVLTRFFIKCGMCLVWLLAGINQFSWVHEPQESLVSMRDQALTPFLLPKLAALIELYLYIEEDTPGAVSKGWNSSLRTDVGTVWPDCLCHSATCAVCQLDVQMEGKWMHFFQINSQAPLQINLN